MKKLVHKSFLRRNSRDGIKRYLSTLGFDVKGGFRIEKSDRKNFVYLIVGEPEAKTEVAEPIDDLTAHFLSFIKSVGGIPLYVTNLLVKAGYDTVGKVAGATDKELMAIPGIAQGRVDAIRKVLGSI